MTWHNITQHGWLSIRYKIKEKREARITGKKVKKEKGKKESKR